MINGLPLTMYQIRQIKVYAKIVLISIVCIIFFGNIITLLVRDRIKVEKNSYQLKDGFPMFTSQKDYIDLVSRYPYNPGVKLKIHTMSQGESYWNITMLYNISIDTLIAANPFLTTLQAEEGMKIVIPEKDGVLCAIDDIIDVYRMKRLLVYDKEIKGDYFPHIFKLYSTDDIRLVFFSNVKPCIVNNSIEKLYKFKNIFQSPVKGYYTSLFGDRVHPFFDGFNFHNGVDILARMGIPIKAARSGMVIFTGWREGYGKAVIIQHRDGYSTLYGHCSSINVKPGDWVTKDDVIGLIGSTGRSTGPHLHFTMMRHGNIVNPLYFIW